MIKRILAWWKARQDRNTVNRMRRMYNKQLYVDFKNLVQGDWQMTDREIDIVISELEEGLKEWRDYKIWQDYGSRFKTYYGDDSHGGRYTDLRK